MYKKVYFAGRWINQWVDYEYLANYNIFSECQKEKYYVTLNQSDRTMINSSVACGDINGDGIDEVVVAGYEAF